jgi:lyso-ornithine lipid O-acyltransferase
VILRRLRRAVALALVLLRCFFDYSCRRLSGPLSLEQQALWMHRAGCAVLACLDIDLQMDGRPPARGLLVANHLSYFDIAVLSAASPCSFVSRADVRHWPFFGVLARCGGTIFLDRASLASANTVATQIASRFDLGVAVALFPEATSTDGSTVQRFHSRLMHPATDAGVPITPVAVSYELTGIPEREVCFYGDKTFAGHLWKVLAFPPFEAHLRFAAPRTYADARIAARETHDEIASMRADATNAESTQAIEALR